MVCAGYHIHILLHHIFIDEVRQDYFENLFHHILVFAAIIPGYLGHFHRGMIPLLLLFDLPDAVT